MTEKLMIEYMGYVYRVDDLREEVRREIEHADNVEQYNADGARQARARAERIEAALRAGGA